MDDRELLRCYVDQGSEPAFREIVGRYVNVIHSTVLRQVGGDVHLAQDVVQRTFVALALKAKTLSPATIVVGWLYTAARLEAARALRTEIRRRDREQKAHAMNSSDPPDRAGALPWEDLSPLLDEAMATLPAADREAVLLRFFSGRSFAEVGRALALTEDTARKRVDRAVEKLRRVLQQRGLSSSSVALGAALSAHAASAPAQSVLDLLAAQSWSALTSSTAVNTGLFMGINKLTASLAAATVFLAVGVLVNDYVTRQSQSRDLQTVQEGLNGAGRRATDLNRQLTSLRQELADRATRRPSPANSPAPTGARADFRSDPAYQRLTITASLARRHQEFQRLYRRLGLNAGQVSEFETIMAIQDQANLDAAAIKAQGGDPQTVYQRSGPDWSSAMKRLLGDAGFVQLSDYLKTMPVRAFIDSLAAPTADLSIPLSLDQADQLADAALANDATYKSGKGTDPGTVDWEAVWPAATRILAPQQLEVFRTIVATWQDQKEIQRVLASRSPTHG